MEHMLPQFYQFSSSIICEFGTEIHYNYVLIGVQKQQLQCNTYFKRYHLFSHT